MPPKVPSAPRSTVAAEAPARTNPTVISPLKIETPATVLEAAACALCSTNVDADAETAPVATTEPSAGYAKLEAVGDLAAGGTATTAVPPPPSRASTRTAQA